MTTDTAVAVPTTTFSGTPRKLPALFETATGYVEEAREATSTTECVWDWPARFGGDAARVDALDLFGPMRDFDEEERAIYDRVAERMSRKTGKNIYESI